MYNNIHKRFNFNKFGTWKNDCKSHLGSFILTEYVEIDLKPGTHIKKDIEAARQDLVKVHVSEQAQVFLPKKQKNLPLEYIDKVKTTSIEVE